MASLLCGSTSPKRHKSPVEMRRYGYRSINSMIKDTFLELVEADLQSGAYSWTILLTRQISSRADASSDAWNATVA